MRVRSGLTIGSDASAGLNCVGASLFKLMIQRPLDTNTSCLESGVQVGWIPAGAILRDAPLIGVTKMPSRLENATRAPSGDHFGVRFSFSSRVIACSAPLA